MPVLHAKPAYRPDIDGLRAIAILAVVFYHAGLPGFSGGFIGVDVFFVISGFLITRIVWSDIAEGSFSLEKFYIRRIKRIFPALFAVLFFCSIAGFILLIPVDLAQLGQSESAAVLFFSNFHWIKHANYFDSPSIEKPLLHSWSLAVEEQFYVAWPLALLLLSRTVSAKKIPYAIFGLALLSLILAEARMPNYQKDAFYLPWCRGCELLLGAALAIAPAFVHRRRLANALAAAGLAAIALAVTLCDPSTRFPGAAALLPCGGAALLLAAGSVSNPLSSLISVSTLRYIGLISYSLYLIHWPLFSFAHHYFNELTFTLRLLIVAASLALAHLTWRYIETPCRRARLPSLKVFAPAAAAMCSLYLCGLAFSASGGFPFRVSEEVLKAQNLDQDISKFCRRLDIPEGKGRLVEACGLGIDRGGAYDFILWGDSHARHFTPAIGTLANAHGVSGILLTKGGCSPFLDDPHASKACRNFNRGVARWIENHAVKQALLGGRWSHHRDDLNRYRAQASPAQNAGGLAKTLAFLNGKGIAVTVLDQIPEFQRYGIHCMARALYHGHDFEGCGMTQPAAAVQSWHRDLDDYFDFLKKEYSFSIASAAAGLCDRYSCRTNQGQTLFLWDDNHLTITGALHAVPYLKIPMLSGAGQESAAIVGTPPPAEPVPAL